MTKGASPSCLCRGFTPTGETSLAPSSFLSVASGCAESEVHRLFCVSVSGLTLGKDGENKGQGASRKLYPKYSSQPSKSRLPSLCSQLSVLPMRPLTTEPLSCSPQSLTVVFREPFPVQPQDSESPPAQLVSTYHHLESVINTACFTLWTRLL